MVVRQGDVFWVRFGRPTGSGAGHLRPAVVIQNDLFNLGRIQTVMVAVITTNVRLGLAPGNVRLKRGAANLPKPSTVNVTQVATVDRNLLVEKIGTLPRETLEEIIEGLLIVVRPRYV